MRPFRLLATAATAVLLSAAVVVSPSGAAATNGIGTASTSTKVVEIAVGADGAVLKLGLLADEARSTIDPAVATPEAFSRLLRLNVKTPLDAVNNLVASLPAVEARQPGGDQVKEVPGTSATVALPASPVGQAASLGSIDLDAVRLTASLAAGAAQSGISAGVSKASVAGGLISATGAKVNLSTSSAPGASEAIRSVTVTDVTVIDLGALLKGLGIDLSTLPVSSVSALLAQLGLQDAVQTATGISLTGTLEGAVATINGAVTTLTAQATGAGGTVDSVLFDALGLVGVTSPVTVNGVIDATQATALLAQVQSQLSGLLTTSLTQLATTPLFRVGGVNVGMTTKAVEDVNQSVASITGKVGTVKVGSIELLGGVDLLAATDRVNAIVADANARIGAALGAISPELAGVVKVSVLNRDTSVTKTGDYVRSLAGITAASATITPPATLAAVLNTLTNPAAATIGQAITAAGGAVPQLETLMAGLQQTLTLGAGVLASPSTVKIAQILSASEFKVQAVPATPTTPGSELPRTGGTSLLLLGGGAAVLALAARRLLRSPGLHRTNR